MQHDFVIFGVLLQDPDLNYPKQHRSSRTQAGLGTYKLSTGAYAAFTAGGWGGGCTLSLSGPYVSSPLKYISMYNTEGGLFCSEKKKNVFV